jgi:hypothetical protein
LGKTLAPRLKEKPSRGLGSLDGAIPDVKEQFHGGIHGCIFPELLTEVKRPTENRNDIVLFESEINKFPYRANSKSALYG